MRYVKMICVAALLLLIASPALAAEGNYNVDAPENQKPQKAAPPAETFGLKFTLRPSSGGGAGQGAKAVAGFRNITNKPIVIKNEFMAAMQKNSSFIRVYIDQKETAATGLYRKNPLIRDGKAVITIAPGEEKNVFDLEFFDLPTGPHTVFVIYSSQVANYEKNKYSWWLGSARSNSLSFNIRHADLDKQITAAGNKVMANIASDLAALSKSYSEISGIGGANLAHGVTTYQKINQLAYKGPQGLSIVIQIRGMDETITPMAQFDRKFPFLNVTVVCWYSGGRSAQLRNAVFNTIRDRSQDFNLLTREASNNKEIQIRKVSEDTNQMIDEADLIVHGQVTAAEPQMQENGDQLWVVTVKPIRVIKGRTKSTSLVLFTDSPTVRFNGPFINRQFIMYLDLKYADPETFKLIGSDPLSNDISSLIEERVKTQKK